VAEVGEFFADVLRARWINGLHKVTTPRIASVEAWLQSGAYAWLPSRPGSVWLDISATKDVLADALASEVARFSCAAYESLIDAHPGTNDCRALNWSLVRYYYATFYAGHAILRLSGCSVTMLSPQTVSIVNRIGGQYLGMSPQLVSGLHQIQIDPNDPSKVEITKVGGGTGGSHEEMWKLFLDLVNFIEGQLIANQAQSQEAQAAVVVLTELRQQLCRQGKNNGAWLSMVRNNLNYKHDYGVWYPYSVTLKFAAGVSSRMSRWAPGHAEGYEIGKSNDELACFVDTCNVMTRLLTCALGDLAQRAQKAKSSFVDRTPFRLLRLRKFSV
jgi:hypothetical protein